MWFQVAVIPLLVLILFVQLLILINIRNLSAWAAVISSIAVKWRTP